MRVLLKILFVLLLISHASIAAAQQHIQDLAKDKTSRERTAILDALRAAVGKDLRQDVKFVVNSLKVYGGFAFLRGNVKSATGGDIDFSKIPAYKSAVADGIFDGDGMAALLKKSAGSWRWVTHVIGPTDVAWACWWKDYKAPKQIFDVAESCAY